MEPKLTKILHVDLQSKEHNLNSPKEFIEKRGDSGLIKMIKLLSQNYGIENKIISLTRKKGGDNIVSDGVEFIFIEAEPSFLPNKKYFNLRMYSRAIERYISDQSPDIVRLCQSERWNFYVLCNFLRRKNIKYAIHFQGGNLKHFILPRKHSFKNASYIILNNDIQRDQLLKHIPDIKDRICIMPIGIDPEIFYDKGNKKMPLSFGYTGRLYEHKGLIDAVYFIKQVRSHYGDVKYYIAGNFESESFKNKLYRIISENGLEDNIKFMGYLNKTEIVNFYNSFTYLLFLSKFESYSQSVAEAMLSGAIPIIRKGSSGPEDKVINGKTGYVLKNLIPDKELIHSLEDENKINELRNNIKEISENFKMGTVVAKVAKVAKYIK